MSEHKQDVLDYLRRYANMSRPVYSGNYVEKWAQYSSSNHNTSMDSYELIKRSVDEGYPYYLIWCKLYYKQ